ncbi:MAG TPA: glycogen synthase GlgA [Nitrospirota bacterium]|nr:glycogen synthase GlgA [Nitrospirota bacterium]
MRILFATSEAAPFAKTGGLADVAGSLPPAIASLGHEVTVVMPRYRQVDVHALKLKRVTTFMVPLGTWKERCDVLKGTMGNNVTVYFINKDVYYDRPELYGTTHGDYSDNAERFIFFSRSVLELCEVLQLKPDIVHCNDWQTGLVPLYLQRLYGSAEMLRKTKTVFTVHNLGYQGLFWHWDMRLTGLEWNVFTPEGIEFWGKMNLLKAGLVSADIITTVSKTYSREIQTPEYGCGLEGVLRERSADLYGIVNGIDYKTYDPLHDHAIPHRYSASRLSGKAGCKKRLLELVNLPDKGDPLIGMVTRLVDQKGLDILTDALPDIMSLGVQLIILGSGEAIYHRLLTDAASRNGNAMRVLLQYDEGLAKNIYSGSDMFLMPSRYEPCGLGQMIALRYGAVPIVRRTGGLSDTVVDYNARAGRGTGFLFNEYSAPALVDCIRHALKVFSNKAKWQRIMKAGMNEDFSWEHSAKEYAKLYQKVMKRDRV